MTAASDNAFTSLLITEGTEPSAPAAGKQRLYIDSTTHRVKITNSSGTDLHVGADNLWTSGTSMPGSPATNQRVTRTDINNMDFFYDGTRWRSVTVFMAGPINNAFTPLSANGNIWSAGLWKPTYSVYLLELRGLSYVSTTNDGSRYWTIAVKNFIDGASIASFNTSADTAGTDTSHVAAIAAVHAGGGIFVDGTKTSTPGNLSPMVNVTYQVIAT